jgi:hypothetical protein
VPIQSSSRSRGLFAALLTLALAITAIVYWPTMHGGYVFDDYPNIVQNGELHLRALDFASLREAALSSPSTVLIRPLAMLSFGLDWYLGGGNPFEMKLVNLAIHLLNGIVLFALLRRVTRRGLATQSDALTGTRHADVLALCIAVAWLLAPINFTAVGYIVQRMESLCQLFVLAGLLGYVHARERMLAHSRRLAMACLSIVLGTAVGALSKESALLLPLYAFIAEWMLFNFTDASGKVDRRLIAFYIGALAIPGCIAAAWALLHALSPGAWANRPFTLWERLLTEPRILFDYVHWSLLPTPDALALYHDQIPVSRGLLSPPTTLLSILGLIAAACVVPMLRRRRPLVALGLGWFLCAHLLTATVIPLELVFEHRNYFASIGLYTAVVALLMPHRESAWGLARASACIALLFLFASVTFIRALDWSNPVTFALSEAYKNPDSPRTAYELGRTYVILSQYRPDSPLVPQAYAALAAAAAMPGADALPDQALLILSGRLHKPAPPGVWKRFQHRLASQPLSAQNLSALYSITRCAIDGDCSFPQPEVVQSFIAALSHTPPNVRVLSIYADYAINVLHDPTLALDLARDGLQREPDSLQARRNLMLLLQSTGRHDEALALYEQTLHDLPDARSDRRFMEWSRQLLEPASSPAPAPAPTPPRSLP